MATEHILVLNTCPNKEIAEHIASTLVESGAAACVNILPGITSVYKWKGKKEIDSEVLLFIKTRADRFETIKGLIKQHHPYELPEIVAVSLAEGLPEYLSWIDNQVRIP